MEVDEKEFFREATLRICGSLEIEQALYHCFTYIRNFLPADQMTLNFWNSQDKAIIIYASATTAGGYRLNTRVPISRDWQQAIIDREQFPDLLIINRIGRGSLAEGFLKTLGKPNSSLLSMRLRLEGELLGNLSLRADGKNRYSPDHEQLIFLLNDPWAIALTNSRRYQELADLKELLADDNRYLQNELQQIAGDEIIGADKGLKEIITMIRQVAPGHSPVLLLGETGVGKEVFARAIHKFSPRKHEPFIKVDCGAIPDTLIDSELFGHEKGAFTGAIALKRGRFERAHGGTIFLDEIGELPLEAQTRLLRVLQDKEIERVGGTQPTKVDLRVIAATHRNLEEMVGAAWFREDLYYRLKVFPIVIPALRHHKSDIPDLVEYFMRRKALELGQHLIPRLSPFATDRLLAYDWPGNVRELENAVERSLILNQGEPLTFDDLKEIRNDKSALINGSPSEVSLNLELVVANHIRNVLSMAEGRVEGERGAAKMMGINPGTLRHRMRKLGIPFGRKAKKISKPH